MADTFTDGTEDFSEVLLSPDPDEGSAETSETVPEVSEQPALSVPSEQDAVDHEAVSSDDVAASSGEETAEGVETISAFAKRIGAELTVMPNGEHWFHTEEQMRFLDGWIAG